jgi:GT2 family glycosyltransferase
MAPQPTSTPTWTWCVATYNRHDVLARACALALGQSVPPAEIVVTDASADWEEGRRRIGRVLERAAEAGVSRPRLSYEKASRPSLPAQRNESIARSSADVLFLLDDDTLMFPDTAERVLEVYARDVDGVVQAVTTRNTPETPDDPPWSPASDETDAVRAAPKPDMKNAVSLPKRARHPLALALRRVLRADERFVPYDPEPRVHPVPASLEGLDLRSWKMAAGYHLTARREAVLREPFEARLKGYSPGEDSDATYRLTRHGPILHRPDARIHHIEAPGARFGQFRRTALGALNSLLLHRVHSTDRAYSARENRALLRRRLLIEFAKDVQNLDWSAPRARAIAFALRHLDEIMSAGDAEIDALFERFQAI